MADFAQELHDAIVAVCPIEGVAIGRVDDKSTWRIDFRPEAIDQQKQAAQDVLLAFTPAIPGPSITSQIEALALPPTLAPLRAILKRLAGGK